VHSPAATTIGLVTIGQAPRTDVVPEMLQLLGAAVRIREAGALDGLSRAEVRGLAPRPEDEVLVTRLRDGTSVQVAEREVVPRLQERVDALIVEGADVVALLCTGEFPAFGCPRLLLRPQVVLHHFVASVAHGRRLGVVVPVLAQVTSATRRWRTAAGGVCVVAASPYTADAADRDQAIEALRDWGADLVVLDCLGFDRSMKARAAAIAGVPMILPRTVLARTLAELAAA
jgi:protein AroM